ncbi:MAG: DUF6686 family protein [Algibacter sp.]
MCDNNIKILSKVKSGELSVCKACKIYHLEFNNIYLEFNRREFEQFKDYILDLEMDYWEHKYARVKMKRKIPIPSMQPNLVLMFRRQEIKELQKLLTQINENTFNTYLEVNDIDYKFILN